MRSPKAELRQPGGFGQSIDGQCQEEVMKSAFDKIAAGLGDAIAHADGEPGRAKVAAPIDVKAIYKRTGKTHDWEQSRSQPDAHNIKAISRPRPSV